MQHCGFRDSCVTELGATRLVEEATAFPLTIHPMLIGSGVLGIGLDASGLQAVDSRMAPAFGLESSRRTHMRMK